MQRNGPLGFPDPFYSRTAIQDYSRFFGRREELTTIYDLLRKQQSVSIVGPLRTGKASLLHMLGKPECQQDAGYDLSAFVFIFLDFSDYQLLDMKQENFFQDACRKIVAVCQQQVSDFESSATDWPTRFRDLLQHLNNQGKHPVLLMNAFDKVTRNEIFDLRFFSFLRSLARRNIVCFATASNKPLAQVCHQYVKDSPFFDVFKEYVLGPLQPEEARDLIMSLAQHTPYAFTAGEMQWVLEHAGRNPFLLQIVCSEAFHEKKIQKTKELDDDGLKVVSQRVYQEIQPLFDSIWMSLNDVIPDPLQPDALSREQRILKDEARRRSSSTRLRQIPVLSESWLMRKCINERFNVDEPEISLDDVKAALRHLDDVEALGNSKLAETYYVRSRYEKEKDRQAIKKGRIVLSLLKEALKLMSSDGIRADHAPEWRLYNIIYYHYLQYRLHTEQIMARLGIRDKRTFYRRQDDAVKQLLTKVCLLEALALDEPV
jgi:hypothetical protein